MNRERSESKAMNIGQSENDRKPQTNAAKRVNITIESRQDNEPFMQQRVQAFMYQKEGSTIYRYEEPTDDMGRTTTTVKVSTGRTDRLSVGSPEESSEESPEISIIRHGEVRSAQTFIRNQTTNGFLQLPQGRMLLRMETTEVDVQVSGGFGSIRWQYRLYTNDHLAGMYQVKLNIQEEQEEAKE